AGVGDLRVPPGPVVRDDRHRRRDQPRLAQDPVGAAGVHAGASGHRRRHLARAAGAVHGHRHPEPGGDGGHLPAAGGAARPLHGAGEHRLPRRGERAGAARRRRLAAGSDDAGAHAGPGDRHDPARLRGVRVRRGAALRARAGARDAAARRGRARRLAPRGAAAARAGALGRRAVRARLRHPGRRAGGARARARAPAGADALGPLGVDDRRRRARGDPPHAARPTMSGATGVRVTARGWGMLLVGALLAAVAAALQSLTTARIAAVVLAIPVVALLWALVSSAFASRRGLRRTLRPRGWQVDVGGSVELTPTGAALPPWSSLRERVPATLRRRGLGPYSYAVLPSQRGRHVLGPAVLVRSDAWAIVWWRTPIGDVADVLVWPRTEHVDDAVVARALEASAPRSHGLPQRTLEDLTVREYRRGDDLHRVHWRSTARHGELMVRHDEPTTTRVIDVLLLLGDERDDAAEWAVSAAASMAVALLRGGYTVRVVTVADGRLVDVTTTTVGDALDLFALAEPAAEHAADALRSVQRSTSAGVVAVLDRPAASLDASIAAGGALRQ